MKTIFKMLVLAIVGAFTFSSFGFSASSGSLTAIGLGLLSPKSEASSAYSGLDLSEINAQLGAYARKYDKKIWSMVTREISLENYTRKVSGVSHQYVVPNATTSSILQPFQQGFTPKGGVKLNARVNSVQHFKADLIIDNLHELWQSHLDYMADESKTRDKWPFIPWVINENVVPKIIEEMAFNAVSGEYVAPVAGTPGASAASVDGMLTVISDEITATNITPLTTGIIAEANIVDKVDGFIDDISADNPKWKRMIKNILMSDDLVTMYKRAREDQHGQNMDYKGMEVENKVKVRGSNIYLVGIPEMNGSQRMIATYDGNLLTMYDKIARPNGLDVQLEKRDVCLLMDAKRGYGFGTYDGLFVNDQA